MTASESPVVRVERDIAAPPDAVFDAWTDPASVSVWMAPDPMTVAAAECDPRVGGAFRIVMVGEFGAVEHTGVYEQVTRPRRLVFTWHTPHLGERTTRVRVDFTAIPGGTRMVIEHIGLPAPRRRGPRSRLGRYRREARGGRPAQLMPPPISADDLSSSRRLARVAASDPDYGQPGVIVPRTCTLGRRS